MQKNRNKRASVSQLDKVSADSVRHVHCRVDCACSRANKLGQFRTPKSGPRTPSMRLTDRQASTESYVPLQMDPKHRVGQRPVRGKRVEQRRRTVAPSDADRVGDVRQTWEPEPSDPRDVLRGQSEVGARDQTWDRRRGSMRVSLTV